jgi:hypothetical protein
LLTGAGAGRAGAAQLYRKLRAALVQNMLSQVRAQPTVGQKDQPTVGQKDQLIVGLLPRVPGRRGLSPTLYKYYATPSVRSI